MDQNGGPKTDEEMGFASGAFNRAKSLVGLGTEKTDKASEEYNWLDPILKGLGLTGAGAAGVFGVKGIANRLFSGGDAPGLGWMGSLVAIGAVVAVVMNWDKIDNALGISDKFNSMSGAADAKDANNLNADDIRSLPELIR